MFGVEHEEYLEAVDLTSYVGTIPTGPTSYFQVNNGVLYYLDYVEGIYIGVLVVLGSILNPNHIVFAPSNKLYSTIRASLFPFQSLT